MKRWMLTLAILTASLTAGGCSLLFPEEAELVGVQIELEGFAGKYVWVVVEGNLAMHAKLDDTVNVVGAEATALTYAERGLRWIDVQWDDTSNPVQPSQYRTQVSLDNADLYFVRVDVTTPATPSVTVQTTPFAGE